MKKGILIVSVLLIASGVGLWAYQRWGKKPEPNTPGAGSDDDNFNSYSLIIVESK